MRPRPMIEVCGRWAKQAAQAGTLAWLVAAGPGAIAQGNGAAGPAVYRCGSSYSSTPCPGGHAVATDDARSTEQQREAQDVKRRDAALADQMAADRRAAEREAARKPAVGIAPPPAASAPQRASTTMTTTTKKKKKTVTQKPATTSSQKLSSAR